MYAKVLPTAGSSMQDPPPVDNAGLRAENAADDISVREASHQLALTALTLVALVFLTNAALAFVSRGRGPFLYDRGSVREGGYEKVDAHDRGRIMYPSGDVCEEDYLNDKKNVRHMYTSANGDICHDEKSIGERQDGAERSVTVQVNGVAAASRASLQLLQSLATSKKVADSAGPGNETALTDDGSTRKVGVVEEPMVGATPSVAGLDGAAASQPLLGLRSKVDKAVDSQGDDEEATGSERVVGIIKFDSGGVFIGEVLDGKMHRKGVYRWANGDAYEGELDDGEMHGNGVYTLANGNVYEGEWRAGKRHGSGVYTWANGDMYKGEWREGEKHGKGVYTLANGVEHQGEFVYNAWYPGGNFKEGVCGVLLGLTNLLGAMFLSK